jgi:RNA polymerase sigma-70 factor (ECF subfamily)
MTVVEQAPGDFAALAAPLRREVLAHCYRMLGSAEEAEDAVQETYLRAWRAYDRFEGRAGLRTWLYRIATNVCLTALAGRPRRALPAGLEGAHEPRTAWLEPLPDPADGDPATVVADREHVRLALVAGLQHLPPGQRAVLILRDVLAFPAADVAEMLGLSVAAVKSSLQRARARLARAGVTVDDVDEPTEATARAQLDRYVTAFETADVRVLQEVLRADAALELLPAGDAFRGMAACLPVLADAVGVPGEWRMLPVGANGQPAVAAYRRDNDGVHRALGIAVLTSTPSGIARITVFEGPVAPFGRPDRLGDLADRVWS